MIMWINKFETTYPAYSSRYSIEVEGRRKYVFIYFLTDSVSLNQEKDFITMILVRQAARTPTALWILF